MEDDKAISVPVKDISQLKIVLATWYSFLREHSKNFTQGDYSRYLKTPVFYDLSKDEIELLFTGSDEILKEFREHIFKKTEEQSEVVE